MATVRNATKAVEEIVRRPYSIEFEYGDTPEDGVRVYVAEWPDCFAAGNTREQAIAELEDALRELAGYRLRKGLPIPEPVGTLSGKVLLRMPKKLHQDAERRATAEGVSLNTWLTTAIARELGPATGSTQRRRKKTGRRR